MFQLYLSQNNIKNQTKGSREGWKKMKTTKLHDDVQLFDGSCHLEYNDFIPSFTL